MFDYALKDQLHLHFLMAFLLPIYHCPSPSAVQYIPLYKTFTFHS